MQEKCEVLWTAKCRISFPGPSPSTQNEYDLQHRFSLRYYPESKALVRIDENVFESPTEFYVCVPPDTKFRLNNLKEGANNSFGYFDIIFLANDPIMQERLRQGYPPHQVGEAERVMLNYIIENWHRKDAEIQSNCNSFLTALLLLLFAEQTKPESLGSQFILTEGYSRATMCALDYIERNYLSYFTLDELATATGYNKNYLCMSFSKNTGTSIVSYTNFLRVRKAIGTILYSSRSINRISSGLGFDSPNYFGRTFKAFTGISPREFNNVARKMTPEEKADLYENEPLLKYRRYHIEEIIQSMRHIGDVLHSFSATHGEE